MSVKETELLLELIKSINEMKKEIEELKGRVYPYYVPYPVQPIPTIQPINPYYWVTVTTSSSGTYNDDTTYTV